MHVMEAWIDVNQTLESEAATHEKKTYSDRTCPKTASAGYYSFLLDLPVQFYFSHLVVLLMFISRFAFVRKQIDSNTVGSQKNIWTVSDLYVTIRVQIGPSIFPIRSDIALWLLVTKISIIHLQSREVENSCSSACPNCFQPSSRIALVYQSVYSRMIAD